MSSLHKYFLNNSGRGIHKWLHYFDIYERHFERFVGKTVTVLEVGVGRGGALRMWKAYFGPRAKILGLDIREETRRFEEKRVHMYIGDQTDPLLYEKMMQEHGRVDIVIDDGSHIMEHMIGTFEIMYDKISDNGVYLIEDVHTSYVPNYNGGLKKPGTIIEHTKDLIDRLHAHRIKDGSPLQPDKFTRSTDGIHIYDSVIVFEKRRKAATQSVKTAAMAPPPAQDRT